MSWQILPDPLTQDVYKPSGAYTESPEQQSAIRIALFGRGVLRPFRRSKNADDFEAGEGGVLLRAAVGLVLGTICQSESTQGELPWRTEFGSLLQLLRHRNLNSALEALARSYVGDALHRWIPAIQVTKFRFLRAGQNTLFMELTYAVVDPVGRQVLVPGLQTSVAIG